MAGLDPVSAGLGAVSLISGISGGKGTKKAADKVQGKANKLIDRKTNLYDSILKIVQDYDKQGGFNPDKLVKQASADINYQSGIDQGNEATAARTLGYNIGDTQPLKRISAISQGYKLKFADLANQIRTGAFTNQLGAYNNIPANLLDSGIAAYSGKAQQATQQAQGMNPAGFLQAFLPSLGGKAAPAATTAMAMPQSPQAFPSRTNGFALPEYGSIRPMLRPRYSY